MTGIIFSDYIENMDDHIPHPFVSFIPPNAETLIVGTFPPVEKHWAFPFFYPNKRNRMWSVLSALAEISLEKNDNNDAIAIRKAILIKLKAGITDMGRTIRRIHGNSLDENLELVELMEILTMLKEHPGISRVILTSSSGPVSALKWFSRHLTHRGVAHTIPKGNKPLSFAFESAERTYTAHILYSTSPRASNRINFEDMVSMYRRAMES